MNSLEKSAPPSQPPPQPPAAMTASQLQNATTTKTWQCHHNNLSFSHDFNQLYTAAAAIGSSSDKRSSSSVTASQTAANTPRPDDEGAQQQQQLAAPSVQIWYCIHFMRLCQICLAMPLIGLVACLLIAVIFQFGDIQETACKVRHT